MFLEALTYDCHGVTCKGHLAAPAEAKKAKKPGIVIAHAWRGQDDLTRRTAKELAEIGYVALAADIYGDGQTATTDEQATQLMMPLFIDRTLLRERINAAVDALKKHPLVDATNVAAIGFCFGGLTVIELLRSGADVRGVVSFHGVLGNAMGDNVAKTAPLAKKMHGALLMLHGNDDPLVSATDFDAIRKEFTKANVDWQMNIYGHTVHAFTNPAVHDVKGGLAYNEKAAARSWIAMQNFLNEIFK